MHCLVAWRFNDPAEPRRAQLTVDLLSAFSGTRFAKVLDDVFVVGIEGAEDYDRVRNRVSDIAEGTKNAIFLIVSPPMPDGTAYRGYLPTAIWDELNKVTGAQVEDDK